jgi:release factor glutamine methyltransferase
MYRPREDSFLILKHIKDYAKGSVLEIGTGSGILAIGASKYSKKVTACDINEDVIMELKKNKKIKFIHSDLFSNIGGKFDLIMFNPPYLPSKKIEDIEIDGGKNGTQIIGRFLREAKKYLNAEGKILLLCSSLNKDIEKLFEKCGYRAKIIGQESFFFERLFLYELS